MKYVLVVGSGMADAPLPQLAGHTPMEVLALNSFDRVAGCFLGRALTVPHGMPADGAAAMLSIFGCAPQAFCTGSSALEAAGMGVSLPEGAVSLYCDLCSVTEDENGAPVIGSPNGGGIHGREAVALMNDLLAQPDFAALMEQSGLSITVTDTFRHIAVMTGGVKEPDAVRLTGPHTVPGQPILPWLPCMARQTADTAARKLCRDIRALMMSSRDILQNHPINRARVQNGLLPANMLWLWGASSAVHLPDFRESFGHHGSVISAMPLVRGIACLTGLKAPRVEGATGELNTNYAGKVAAALQALDGGDDFVAVHVHAPDQMARSGDLAGKLEAVQNVEYRVVMPLLNQLMGRGEDFRLMLISDHPTLLTTRRCTGLPVPYAVFDSRTVRRALDEGREPPLRKFSEEESACEPVLMDGTELMKVLFER